MEKYLYKNEVDRCIKELDENLITTMPLEIEIVELVKAKHKRIHITEKNVKPISFYEKDNITYREYLSYRELIWAIERHTLNEFDPHAVISYKTYTIFIIDKEKQVIIKNIPCHDETQYLYVMAEGEYTGDIKWCKPLCTINTHEIYQSLDKTGFYRPDDISCGGNGGEWKYNVDINLQIRNYMERYLDHDNYFNKKLKELTDKQESLLHELDCVNKEIEEVKVSSKEPVTITKKFNMTDKELLDFFGELFDGDNDGNGT